MELTADFMDALKNSITSIASTTDLKIETDHFALSDPDKHFDMYYMVTVPRAELANVLQRLEDSIQDDTLSTIVSNELGTPVNMTGNFRVLDLYEPTYAPASIPREDAGDGQTRKYNRSFHA